MTDEELVKALKLLAFVHNDGAMTQAADRIEALTEQLEAARADAKEAEAYAEELEAKLAKAVEGLRFYAEGRWPEDYPGGVLHDVDGVTHIDYGHKATATLAEIEGEKG
jgi:hypothetical protein